MSKQNSRAGSRQGSPRSPNRTARTAALDKQKTSATRQSGDQAPAPGKMSAERKAQIRAKIMAKIRMLIAFDKNNTKDVRQKNIQKIRKKAQLNINDLSRFDHTELYQNAINVIDQNMDDLKRK